MFFIFIFIYLFIFIYFLFFISIYSLVWLLVVGCWLFYVYVG